MIAGGRTDLRRILTAYTVNELGTWFGYIALAVAVYDHTHSALQIAGLFICARCVPAFLVPVLVARVESSHRRGELSGLYFVEAATAIALAVLLSHFWMPGILVLTVVDGTAALAASALLRAAAERAGAATERSAGEPSGSNPDLGARRANALLNIAFSASVAIGPAVAGAMVGTTGAAPALYVDAASFVVCGALLLALRPQVEDLVAASVRARLAQAWRHIRAVPQLQHLLVAESLGLVFFTATAPVEVIYARATLASGDAGFGAISAVWGVGMVVGSLIFKRAVDRPLGPLLVMGTAGVGLAYIGFSAAPNLTAALAVALVGGGGNGVQWAAFISSVQHRAPSSLQGQMMGLVEAMGSLCPAIGFSLGGLVATATNPRIAYLFAGTAAAAVSVVFIRSIRGTRTTGDLRDQSVVANARSSRALDPAADESVSAGVQ